MASEGTSDITDLASFRNKQTGDRIKKRVDLRSTTGKIIDLGETAGTLASKKLNGAKTAGIYNYGRDAANLRNEGIRIKNKVSKILTPKTSD